MDPREGRQDRTEPTHDRPEDKDKAVAPPIEREHETAQGALEEDEKRRKQQQEQQQDDPMTRR